MGSSMANPTELEPVALMQIMARFFELHDINYRVCGSLASMAYGEPRFTNDVDILVELTLDKIASLCNAFDSPDYYVSEIAAREAIRSRRQFNIIHPASGLKVDLILPPDTEFGRLEMSRGERLISTGELTAWFSSPEDVLLNKLIYFRIGSSEKHLRDIAGMMKLLKDRLDTAYVDEWASKLGVMDKWHMVRDRVNEAKG